MRIDFVISEHMHVYSYSIALDGRFSYTNLDRGSIDALKL